MQIRKGIILVSIRPIVLYLSVKVKRCTGNEEEVKFNCFVCSFACVKMTPNRVVGVHVYMYNSCDDMLFHLRVTL